jgi:hypothetical protein
MQHMAPRTPKIRLLRDRRRALDDQIVKLEAELAKLREEAKEFEIAERVLLSLGGDDEDDGQEISLSAAATTSSGGRAPIATIPAVVHTVIGGTGLFAESGNDSTAQVETTPRKPPDIPSTPEMIFIALKEMTSPMGASKTKAPLEIMEFIKKRWWPFVTSKDISPVVWRMAHEGRLFKDDAGGYGLPRSRPRIGKDENAA